MAMSNGSYTPPVTRHESASSKKKTSTINNKRLRIDDLHSSGSRKKPRLSIKALANKDSDERTPLKFATPNHAARSAAVQRGSLASQTKQVSIFKTPVRSGQKSAAKRRKSSLGVVSATPLPVPPSAKKPTTFLPRPAPEPSSPAEDILLMTGPKVLRRSVKSANRTRRQSLSTRKGKDSADAKRKVRWDDGTNLAKNSQGNDDDLALTRAAADATIGLEDHLASQANEEDDDENDTFGYRANKGRQLLTSAESPKNPQQQAMDIFDFFREDDPLEAGVTISPDRSPALPAAMLSSPFQPRSSPKKVAVGTNQSPSPAAISHENREVHDDDDARYDDNIGHGMSNDMWKADQSAISAEQSAPVEDQSFESIGNQEDFAPLVDFEDSSEDGEISTEQPDAAQTSQVVPVDGRQAAITEISLETETIEFTVIPDTQESEAAAGQIEPISAVHRSPVEEAFNPVSALGAAALVQEKTDLSIGDKSVEIEMRVPEPTPARSLLQRLAHARSMLKSARASLNNSKAVADSATVVPASVRGPSGAEAQPIHTAVPMERPSSSTSVSESDDVFVDASTDVEDLRVIQDVQQAPAPFVSPKPSPFQPVFARETTPSVEMERPRLRTPSPAPLSTPKRINTSKQPTPATVKQPTPSPSQPLFTRSPLRPTNYTSLDLAINNYLSPSQSPRGHLLPRVSLSAYEHDYSPSASALSAVAGAQAIRTPLRFLSPSPNLRAAARATPSPRMTGPAANDNTPAALLARVQALRSPRPAPLVFERSEELSRVDTRTPLDAAVSEAETELGFDPASEVGEEQSDENDLSPDEDDGDDDEQDLYAFDRSADLQNVSSGIQNESPDRQSLSHVRSPNAILAHGGSVSADSTVPSPLAVKTSPSQKRQLGSPIDQHLPHKVFSSPDRNDVGVSFAMSDRSPSLSPPVLSYNISTSISPARSASQDRLQPISDIAVHAEAMMDANKPPRMSITPSPRQLPEPPHMTPSHSPMTPSLIKRTPLRSPFELQKVFERATASLPIDGEIEDSAFAGGVQADTPASSSSSPINGLNIVADGDVNDQVMPDLVDERHQKLDFEHTSPASALHPNLGVTASISPVPVKSAGTSPIQVASFSPGQVQTPPRARRSLMAIANLENSTSSSVDSIRADGGERIADLSADTRRLISAITSSPSAGLLSSPIFNNVTEHSMRAFEVVGSPVGASGDLLGLEADSVLAETEAMGMRVETPAPQLVNDADRPVVHQSTPRHKQQKPASPTSASPLAQFTPSERTPDAVVADNDETIIPMLQSPMYAITMSPGPPSRVSSHKVKERIISYEQGRDEDGKAEQGADTLEGAGTALHAQPSRHNAQPILQGIKTLNIDRTDTHRRHSSHSTVPSVQIRSADPEIAAHVAAILKVHHDFQPDAADHSGGRHRKKQSDKWDHLLQEAEADIVSHMDDASTRRSHFSASPNVRQQSRHLVPSARLYAPVDFADWTKTNWRQLEHSVKEAQRAAYAHDEELPNVEQLVHHFASEMSLEDSRMQGHWSRQKLRYRVEALLERRCNPNTMAFLDTPDTLDRQMSLGGHSSRASSVAFEAYDRRRAHAL